MTEPTYTITLTESELVVMAQVLGGLVTKLTNCRVQIEAPAGGTHTARALLSPSTAAPAAAQPAPIEQRDRWARNRKGNEVPNPEGSQAVDVQIWKTEQKPNFLTVTWQASGIGRGYIDANCFDQALWPWLIKQKGMYTHLWIIRAKEGKYLNIVGVRA